MILDKISDSNNSKFIAEKYVSIIDSGVPSSEILVLAFNALSKKNIIKNILNLTKNNILDDIKIYTYNGLIYNTVLDNWSYIENHIKDDNGVILPNLCGLELSQFILKRIIKDIEVKGYNSKKSLLHQIFRRYSLIVNNDLSEQEINKKSLILGESFSEDASKIIQRYKTETLSLRSLDYLRQAQIFSHIYKKTDYFKNIRYLITEDTDECSPLMLEFIKNISSQLKDYLVITDSRGCSRCGYLCADMNSSNKLKKIFKEEFKVDSNEKENVTKLVENIDSGSHNIIQNLTTHSLSKRLDMIDSAMVEINSLINSGVKPSEISVVTPVQDKMLQFSIREQLRKGNAKFISGNEKLNASPPVKAVITVLKLASGMPVDEYELRVILSKYQGIPVKNCKNIFETYNKTNSLNPIESGLYAGKYNNFCALIDKLKKSTAPLSEKAYWAYTNMLNDSDTNSPAKFNFFLKELQDFEKGFENSGCIITAEEIITQIENSIISENPYSSIESGYDDLIIATPQKIIDNKIKTKYQLWLDISSIEWIKTDIGPLYNSWVFQKDWNKNEYTIEDNIELSRKKTAGILRKLFNNTENVIGYSSLFDTQGVENFGGIEQYLIPAKKEEAKQGVKKSFKIIPRSDQKAVLEYTNGKMAISAVPGAGKTTILLALILKLLEKGINPENIYVLTYMESAARNFKDRIKNINPDNSKIPNISTIHGLALRIIKENSNYERIGLNPDFDICDDTQRTRIIKTLSKNLSSQELEDFDRAVSVLKLSGAKLDFIEDTEIVNLMNKTKGTYEEMKLSRFLKFFLNYQKLLMSKNLIDYDDILTSAVKLLEENEDVRAYYQELCNYIIEDEAQDSSAIQQKLINLLSAKYGNVIRCGDINQAITTTFTNADTDGFKNFIKESICVNMNCSQRCSEGVWKLANSLVKYGSKKITNAFYEIYMQPAGDKNPKEEHPVYSKIYEEPAEEKIETVRTIKSLLSRNPDCSIGILLRNNYQVNNWVSYLNNLGLSTITRNECLAGKTIFRVIFSILKLIGNPFDNAICAEAYRALAECGIFKRHLDKIIEQYETDFISLDNDSILDADLSGFHWDMNYWLSFPELSVDELVLKIGFNYFSEDIEKSNIYLISTLCARLDNGIFQNTIQRLEELSVRPALSGFKFFSEEDESEKNTGGKIQVMTMHKSKGDEFDYVFIPELSEKNLTLDMDKIKLKKSSGFMENVRALNKTYTPKKENELKEFIISENYRLLYVAITRARKRLYLSTVKNETKYGKKTETEPNIIFKSLLSSDD